MSVQQENEKKNCPGRGLGIAAAAIGVGVGAALYYYFSKRQEPDSEGATTSGWNCEQPHSLSDSSFTTVSEHSTSDTSMNDTSMNETSMNDTSMNDTSMDDTSSIDSDYIPRNVSFSSITSYESNSTESSHSESYQSLDELHHSFSGLDQSFSDSDESYRGIAYIISSNNAFSSFYNNSIDSETGMEWDVTNSSLDVPIEQRGNMSWLVNSLSNAIMRRHKKRETETDVRVKQSQQVFQERTWVPEECAICFDMMSTQQNSMSLPCTHRFHQDCILTWLQEKQTCPVCRKEA